MPVSSFLARDLHQVRRLYFITSIAGLSANLRLLRK